MKNNPVTLPAIILICAVIMVGILCYGLVRAVHEESATREEQKRINELAIKSMNTCLSKLNERGK